MIFWWWDDAMAAADADARADTRRRRVEAFSGMWQVTEVEA